jgi:hypothetical protein
VSFEAPKGLTGRTSRKPVSRVVFPSIPKSSTSEVRRLTIWVEGCVKGLGRAPGAEARAFDRVVLRVCVEVGRVRIGCGKTISRRKLVVALAMEAGGGEVVCIEVVDEWRVRRTSCTPQGVTRRPTKSDAIYRRRWERGFPVKRTRAHGGCLGTDRRRRAW